MVDDKYSLRARIFNARQGCSLRESKKYDGQVLLGLHMSDLQFGDSVGSCVEVEDHRPLGGNGVICLYLNKETANVYGIAWDGTKEGIEEIKKGLEGRTFNFNTGIEQVIGAVR